jgi:hypothetical protein
MGLRGDLLVSETRRERLPAAHKKYLAVGSARSTEDCCTSHSQRMWAEEGGGEAERGGRLLDDFDKVDVPEGAAGGKLR